LIDTHAHLHLEPLSKDPAKYIAEAIEAGVKRIITIGISAESSIECVRLAEEHKQVFAAVGIHPNETAEVSDEEKAIIKKLAKHRHVVAIGETGLDRHWAKSPIEVQEEMFDWHLELARKVDKPVVIHAREADDLLLKKLAVLRVRGDHTGVLHCFGSTLEVAEAAVASGFMISFAGNITYKNKKFTTIREVAKWMPLHRMLIETDAPFLAPEPHRGKDNCPAWVVETAKKIAELREMPYEELEKKVAANATRLFFNPTKFQEEEEEDEGDKKKKKKKKDKKDKK